MIRDIIKDKLREKEWTFGEIANVSETVIELADYAYATMTAKEKLDLIWDDGLKIKFRVLDTSNNISICWKK